MQLVGRHRRTPDARRILSGPGYGPANGDRARLMKAFKAGDFPIMPAQISCRTRAVLAAAALVSLAACEPGVLSKSAQFQRNYSAARTALEQGNYEIAVNRYRALLPTAGPMRPRVRLEYSHALLRNGQNAEAAKVAHALAEESRDTERAAALAVEGTALHEEALALMKSGHEDEARAPLKRAAVALDEMLKLDPSLDPLGSMASRRREIGAELAKLG